MYEHCSQRLIPRGEFLFRQGKHALLAAAIILLGLGAGTLGYHFIEHISWLDSMYGAAMILGGEGPAIEIKSNAGKVFGTIYALFSGIIFLTSATVFVSPTLHRIMHRLHLEDDGDPTNDP